MNEVVSWPGTWYALRVVLAVGIAIGMVSVLEGGQAEAPSGALHGDHLHRTTGPGAPPYGGKKDTFHFSA